MKKTLLTFVLALFASMVAVAQVTTASLVGNVADNYGEVIGANIQALHTPSGTRYSAVSNDKGAFAMHGMRVGGPYKVTVSYIGSQTQVFEDVYLALGETFNLNVKLVEKTDALEEVVVVAQRSKFNLLKTGAATNINNSQINSMPTVNRNITELTRLSPYGGNGMTFAGTDGRTANFTVDGADFNNNFGLSDKLPGGGNPISIEAIKEVQVVISPFDVRQTNFIGGGVNAITKSGTNTYKASAYVYHRNENMQGDAICGEELSGGRAKDRKTTYGITIGGPIIKDKLFYFAQYEETAIPTVVNRWRGSDNGVANADNYISRTTNADLQEVSEQMKRKYGYNTGSWNSFPADEKNRKVLAKIDWNITDRHHLMLRYNYTLNRSWMSPNATSMDGGTRASGARMSQYSMSFANSMYSMENIVHTGALELNSRLTDKISNRFLATFSKHDDVRGSDSDEFPFIDILDGAGQNYMALGYELFTWNNGVHNTHATVKDDVTMYYGKHKITAGFSYEYQMADNAYMRNGTGYYRYNSLQDFLGYDPSDKSLTLADKLAATPAAPEVVCLTYGYGGENEPAARVRFNKFGIYAQDEWAVNDRLNITGGIRFDILGFNNSDLMTNNEILKKDYNGRHIDTGKWPGTGLSVSPRVGVNWDVFGDKSLIVRGGTGLFVGRLPLVFFTNMPTNGGMVQYQAQLNAKNTDMSQFAGGLVKEAGKSYAQSLRDKLIGMGYPANITPDKGSAPSSICGVDPSFKMPQEWKTAIAVDYSVPVGFPLTVTGEFMFTKMINDVCISDWSIPSVGGFARFNGVDNRPIYPAGYRTNTKAFMLENTSKGYGWSASVSVKAKPTKNLDLMAAYTHTVGSIYS